MSTPTMRTITGSQPALRALGSHAVCWHANPAAASAYAIHPMALTSKQATRVRVTIFDFGPRPPLGTSP
jgi:hypothetical protein